MERFSLPVPLSFLEIHLLILTLYVYIKSHLTTEVHAIRYRYRHEYHGKAWGVTSDVSWSTV